ncbi:hypothetical protein [Peterkaempfera griseoplana]|uniref:hypothetical protein n=1 Tax=Peterkaempfera griseoplana TaxID=66896 RepID=UPI0006E39851|nr:hypothetical protein [Peterkaempfera griseoplana]
MTWFNILYYVIMILGFLACLYMAVASRDALKAALWVAASPIVALVAPVAIVFAAIVAVLWLIFAGVPKLLSAVTAHLPHRTQHLPAVPA